MVYIACLFYLFLCSTPHGSELIVIVLVGFSWVSVVLFTALVRSIVKRRQEARPCVVYCLSSIGNWVGEVREYPVLVFEKLKCVDRFTSKIHGHEWFPWLVIMKCVLILVLNTTWFTSYALFFWWLYVNIPFWIVNFLVRYSWMLIFWWVFMVFSHFVPDVDVKLWVMRHLWLWSWFLIYVCWSPSR